MLTHHHLSIEATVRSPWVSSDWVTPAISCCSGFAEKQDRCAASCVWVRGGAGACCPLWYSSDAPML